ncbi:MAG TPA: hypothetical protein VHP33_11480 [Polyangiaceae bacterium]|nr:hypothetical protein [Polyangiaceae bacterium]
MTERLFAFVSAAFLFGCSGGVESYASPEASSPTSASGSPSLSGPPPAATRADPAPTEGTLEIDAGGDVMSFLGAIHAVVTDASGDVRGGADEEAANPELAQERSLRVVLPAGEGLTVSLTATASALQPSTEPSAALGLCTARITALDVAAGATARAQVFSWDCGGVSGYVPSSAAADCYWLADWTLVTRTSAAVGERIAVKAAARGLNGNQPSFHWSAPNDDVGTFDSPSEPNAAFRCQAPSAAVPLSLSLSDGDCTQTVTQVVACR